MPFTAYWNFIDWIGGYGSADNGHVGGSEFPTQHVPADYSEPVQWTMLACSATVSVRRAAFLAAFPERILPRDARWCTANLPPDWSWVGSYHLMWRRGETYTRLNEETYACPHCAWAAYNALVTSGGIPVRGQPVLAWQPPNWTVEDAVTRFISMPELDSLPDGCATAKLPDAEWTLQSSCSTCGRPGHRSSTCTNPPKFHDRVGIEIEGRFDNLRSLRTRAEARGMGGTSDGSVHSGGGTAQPWEFQTEPGSLGQALNQLHDFYPDESDSSCGMHVHVSWTNPIAAGLLGTPEFYAYFKARWTAWGTANHVGTNSEFWRRLQGRNNYCMPNTPASHRSGQLTNMDRYHQLNFSAWSEHSTIECRLLPMFRSEALAQSAVCELISIYEDFLSNVETHLTMPTAECAVERPTRLKSAGSSSLEGFKLVQDKSVRVIEINAIKPPAPGMMRVVVPGGEFNIDSLRKIAALQSARAAEQVKHTAMFKLPKKRKAS